MWSIVGILAAAGIIFWIEAPHLARKRMVKELSIFAVLLFAGVVLSVADAMRFPLPNPLDGITFLLKPVSNILFGLLK